MSDIYRTNNNFDFIRFVAALFVVLAHSFYLIGKDYEDSILILTKGNLTFGSLGVAIFLVISGYLVGASACSSSSFSNFLWKRILRIFPGLFVIVCLTVFVLGVFVSNQPTAVYFKNVENYKYLLNVFLYPHTFYSKIEGAFYKNPCHTINGSLWTIAYEFSFYVILLFLGLTNLIRKKYLILLSFIVLLCTRIYLAEKMYIYSYSTPLLLGLNIVSFFNLGCYFFVGFILYLFDDTILYNFLVLVLVFVVLVLGCIFFSKYIVILLYLLLPYLVIYLSKLKGTLNKFGRYGDFSYGIYIYAYPLQQVLIFIFGRNVNPILFFIYSALITLPFAVLSWHLIEKTALRYKSVVK